METVFDYNITEEERKAIGLSYETEKDKYLRFSEESIIWDLACLFHTRKNKKMMKKYADKLPPNLQCDFYRLISHSPVLL